MSQKFAALADEFDRRIDAYTFTPTTNVRLTYLCVDQAGNELGNVLESLTTVTLTGFGTAGAGPAMKIYKETLHGNINSLVRHASDGWVGLRDVPQYPIQIVTFEMVIEN